MKINATDKQMLEMAAHAANASTPMGLGAFHFDRATEFKPADFKIETGSNPGLYLDYVQGRMVKFTAWRKGEGHWEVRDTLDPEYQSWIRKYPTWKALAESVGATVE